MAADPCLQCGTVVAHEDSLYATQYPGTRKHQAYIWCNWACLKAWLART
jgi:hypothetical protein